MENGKDFPFTCRGIPGLWLVINAARAGNYYKGQENQKEPENSGINTHSYVFLNITYIRLEVRKTVFYIKRVEFREIKIINTRITTFYQYKL
ncbi:hypothetical protein MSSIT_0232 [Methanosarcina siciliae T4/M]|uniref:Uncharacterized protein n=1 Tax=Methanosarcina siciliae T4/M TaxID=1434120 RepID=A0A0E3L7K9_9EURY|nr:hypothetical protein MSSIT_0232 [Methanosarcina siciliae T4/M]